MKTGVSETNATGSLEASEGCEMPAASVSSSQPGCAQATEGLSLAQEVLGAFVGDADVACIVDLSHDAYVSVRPGFAGAEGHTGSYSAYFRDTLAPVLAEDSRDGLRFAEPANVVERLAGRDGFSYDFRLKDGRWWRAVWKSFAAPVACGQPEKCLLLCSDITAQVASGRLTPARDQECSFDASRLSELLDETRTQLAIVDALSRSFENAYIVDVAEGTFRVLKLDGFVTEDLVGPDLKTRHSYLPYLEAYTASRVFVDDREAHLRDLQIDAVRSVLADKDDHTGQYRVVDEDGTQHTCQYRLIVFQRDADGTPHQVILACQNIDDIVEQEARDRQVLTNALAAAEHSSRAKTTFLNNMSHDIRTPINAIIGFTSLAAMHIDNHDQVADYLKKIQTSSQHLLSLINDVLDMSRIESGRIRLDETEVNLASVMHDLKVIVQSGIVSKQLDFFIDTVDVTDEDVVCDRLRLNQILLNLLSNAMKFTEPGGYVSLRIAQLSGAPTGYADYEFRVKDSGVGMSEEFLEHVFEAFERERTTTVSRTPGTGLGMAITKSIVDMMGGTIEAHSVVGRGSEFVVSLRFKVVGKAREDVSVKKLEGLRALVVDDDLDTCKSVSRMLHQIGMHPEWTTSGKEAVHRAAFALEQGSEFYAYIIDWLMPDMNGIEVVRRIRAVIGDTSPIIILTAYDWSDIEVEARQAGVTAFCAKPLFLSELRALLENPDALRPTITDPFGEVDLRGARILLVEDNELNAEISVEILKCAGSRVTVARNGKEALDLVADSPADMFDLVLMDVQMPIMDGYEATRAIRALPDQARAGLPIFAMTANTFEEDRQRALACGMNGHISKPIDIPSLLATIAAALK